MPEPKVMLGMSYMVITGCGHLYVILGMNGSKPLRVTAQLGKSGVCSRCHLEALSESISLGLSHGVPLSEYIPKLKGIRCPSPVMFPQEEEVLSCADGIGRALESFLKESGEKESKNP